MLVRTWRKRAALWQQMVNFSKAAYNGQTPLKGCVRKSTTEILRARATHRIIRRALLVGSLPITRAEVSNDFQRQKFQS